MRKSSDEQATVVSLLGLETNTGAAGVVGSLQNRRGVNTKVDLVVLVLGKSLAESVVLAEVVDMALGGINVVIITSAELALLRNMSQSFAPLSTQVSSVHNHSGLTSQKLNSSKKLVAS